MLEVAIMIEGQDGVKITARLIYRNVFMAIARQKGWPIIDIRVTSMECNGSPAELENFHAQHIEQRVL